VNNLPIGFPSYSSLGAAARGLRGSRGARGERSADSERGALWRWNGYISGTSSAVALTKQLLTVTAHVGRHRGLWAFGPQGGEA